MVNHPDLSTVQNLALFAGIGERDMEWLALHLQSKTFPGDTSLMVVEQPGEVVYIILSGTVKVHIQQAGGSDVVLAILGSGDTVGEMGMLDSAGRSASVDTLEESTVVWMNRQNFQEAMQHLPQLTHNLVRILSMRVRMANEQIQTLATLDVNGRVARQLLAFADKYGVTGPGGETTIPIRLTQGDIADLVGASRKRVNQVMVSFKNYRYISVDSSGRITVHNRAALTRFC